MQLAQNGESFVRPNPLVGCVIVFEDKIIGEGWHEKYGSHHAEVNAIKHVKDKNILPKSTLYVNLEPCAHFGKTPPCADLIIAHKIPNVVIGCVDSFSEVSGNGIEKMREAGINVTVGVLEKECRELNIRFFTFHEKKRPYIILKWAKSTDGFIAPLHQKEPFWMTSNQSKKLVHQWRSKEDSILVGRITAEKDNPSLTVREVDGKNPIRIVLDKKLQLDKQLHLFNEEAETIVFNEIKTEHIHTNRFVKIDFKYMINNLLHELYKLNIQSVLVEGGTKTIQSFIDENIWDEARIFTSEAILVNGLYAPKIKGKNIAEEKIGTDLLQIIKNI